MGQAADQVFVAFNVMLTGLSTTNDKKGKHQLVTKIPMIRPSIVSMDIGKQDTLDDEILAGYNYQIETLHSLPVLRT